MLTEEEFRHIISKCVHSYGAVVDSYFVHLVADSDDKPMQKLIRLIEEAEKDNNKTNNKGSER